MAEEQKKGGGIFGMSKPSAPTGPSLGFISGEVSSISTRMRVLEERSSNTRKKLQLIEQNMLSHSKKFSDETNLLKDEIDEIRRTISEIESRLILVIKEIRLTAKKEDVDVMKRYVEMWEPLNFVTHSQVEKIVMEMLEKHAEK